MNPEMFRLRDRLQAYYLRESAGIVRSLAAERGAELARALKALEEREAALAAVEDRTAAVEQRLRAVDVGDETGPAVDRLLARLDERERALREARQELDAIRDVGRAQLDAAVRKAETQAVELAELRAEAGRREREPVVNPTLRTELDRLQQELRAHEQAELEGIGIRSQLDVWAQELGEREAALHRRELRIGDAESHDARRHELDSLAAVLADREGELADRSDSLAQEEQRLETRRLRAKRQEERLAAIEEDVGERLREFQLREEELDERAARLEVDHELREDRLELKEQRAAELEERLERRQADLAAYVARMQHEFAGRDRLYPRVVADVQ